MRSKIIFVILFMLTITIVHDTLINIISTNENTSISHYMSSDIASQECGDIHEVHSMFHFVGLMIPNKSTFILLPKEKRLSHNILQYTQYYKETSYKPPIV